MTHTLERTGAWFKKRYLGAVGEWQMRWIRRIYERMLSMFTFGRGLPRLINGEDLIRISVHHRYVDEVYEPEVFELLKREVKKNDIIFDVGAYIGIYSIILSRYLGENGRVYAFEPAPDSVSLLEKHLKMNHAGEKVEVLPYGVGERCGSRQLFSMGGHIQNSFSSTAFGRSAETNMLKVSVVSLDAFCAQRSIQPAWVKVDTEGWELPVLRGAKGLFSTDRKVRFVVEMHPYAWRSAGYDAAIFRRFCAEHSLRVEPLSNQNDAFTEYGQVLIGVHD
jgi:FkbM family methyltransferase